MSAPASLLPQLTVPSFDRLDNAEVEALIMSYPDANRIYYSQKSYKYEVFVKEDQTLQIQKIEVFRDRTVAKLDVLPAHEIIAAVKPRLYFEHFQMEATEGELFGDYRVKGRTDWETLPVVVNAYGKPVTILHVTDPEGKRLEATLVRFTK